MGVLQVEDPLLVEVKKVDKSGRVYIGRDYAEKHVKIVVEGVVEDEAEESHENDAAEGNSKLLRVVEADD